MAEKNTQRKWIIWILAAGLVVCGLVWRSGLKHGPFVPVVTVAREDLRSAITSNGKVEPISPAVARAEFSTFVATAKAAEGQAVHRGQVILTLDATDIRAQLSKARADLLTAETNLRHARAGGPPDQVAQLTGDLEKAKIQVANLERTQQSLEQLVAKQAATQDELAQNQAALAQARSSLQILQQKKDELSRRSATDVENAGLLVKQLQDQVEGLEEKVRSATVVAPADGTLYSLPVNQGDYVKTGDVLAEMADLRHVRVRAFVDEPDLGLLQSNQGVEVTWDAKPEKTWTGHTEMLPKQVVPRGTRSVGEVLCSVENDPIELLPNTNVEVRILVRDRPTALVVPRGAVREDKGQHYVFVYQGDKIHRRDVTVGVGSGDKYEILSGLKEGERVAVPRDMQLQDGMDVRPAEAH